METEELKEIARTIYEEDYCRIIGELKHHEIKKIKKYLDELKQDGDMDD